ncbi:SDR family NAD(P)-dependent oxidoreductase [Actinoplanes aureus]|uniref:SDR family NAD(P)-dependent oxidoreductase n=1 Tax=Actinoplanes aureus TaxID=2792083 RepID=A0A931FZX6_9ACTN|nr:SDR family NAD(P)-dependent oxidoreductase [Actinoplanes aureus]MBG0566143.1 SDR family NAD(P)-dependent oxidoreductase [Actinoplanes aureus]
MTDTPLRHTLELTDLPAAPAPAADFLAGRRVLILNGTAEWRSSVRRAVTGHGGTAAVWDTDAPEPPASDSGTDVIIDLGVAADAEVVGPDAWREPMTRTVTALRGVYADWAGEVRTDRLSYVAVTFMGGSMGLLADAGAQPLGGLWAGLAKTLPREFPACRPLVVDLADRPDLGEVVVTELAAGRLLEVGRLGERRVTLLPREQPVDGDPIPVDSSDLLLFTGGARGIGFEIALEMAARYDCEVVVTGRSPLPGPDTSWLTASPAEFAAIERRMYLTRGDTSVPRTRARVAGMRQAREIRHNLSRADERGLRIRYRPCDVTDRADVAALVRSLGDRLSMVVHNAGIDRPARLPKKATPEFLDVIEVKVDGFGNVLAALGDHRLKMLCAVGSQTGRYGGMPGQLDYAAANDGLARLAGWAGHRLGYPVKTLAWPTWEGVGLITNLKAASRYMRPIAVGDGVQAWRAELTRSGSGEIGFMGEIGEVAPQYLNGIPLPPGWAGRSTMLSRRFFLGEVVAYAPGSLLESEHRVDADWATCVDDVRIDGVPALPVSLALEYLQAVSLWLGPPGEEAPGHRYLRDVWVRPGVLRLPPGGEMTLVRRARSRWDGDDWVIDVSLWHGEVCAAEGRVVYTTGDEQPAPPFDAEGRPAVPAAVRYRWSSMDVAIAEQPASGGEWAVPVARTSALDLFTLREPPQPQLPINHLETVIRMSPPAGTDDDREEQWEIDSAWFHQSCREEAVFVRTDADRRRAVIADKDGRALAVLSRPRWRVTQ